MSRKQLSRRDFLRSSSFLVAGGLLAACATAAPAPAQPQESGEVSADAPAPVAGEVVRYWVGWGGTYAGVTWDALQETDEFQETIGNNEFELKGSVTVEAFLTAIAADTPPDGASNIQYVDYMARDVLLPIDDWVANSTILNPEDFVEGNWNQGIWEGTMLGVPANECFLQYGLNYNTRMVEEAGLDPEQPPVTWEEAFAWHEALTKFNAAGNLVQIGLDPYDAMGGGLWDTSPFFVTTSWGWDWFDEDTGEFDLNNEKMVDALETMAEFVKLIGPDNLAGLRSVEGQGGWGGAFNAEVQAMIIEGYWHPGETVAEKPEIAPYNRASWIPVPASRGEVKPQGTGGHLVVIFKKSPNPEPMFRIAEFLNTTVACDIIFDTLGWLPALKSYIAQTDPSAYPGLDFYFRSVEEATEWHAPERCPITEFTNTQFDSLHQGVDREEMTAAEAAAELQRRCEAEYRDAGFGV